MASIRKRNGRYQAQIRLPGKDETIKLGSRSFFGLDNLNLTFQSGYSWSKSQVVTGVGRYLLDGWEYTFNQFKANYNNWFFQTYVNNSYSGETRGYLRGDRIQDYSSNRAYQIQHNFNIKPFFISRNIVQPME